MIQIPSINGIKQNIIAEQQRGELYMRIVKYIAEDYVNHQDFYLLITNMLAWMGTVEARATALGVALSTHTHEITPHIHPIRPHTHNITPHTHVAPPYGGPCSPTPLITMPSGPGVSQTNAPLQTMVPLQASALEWPSGTIPTTYVNTSGVLTNMVNNKVIPMVSTIGDPLPHQRRSMPAPVTLVPTIPPYLVPTPV